VLSESNSWARNRTDSQEEGFAGGAKPKPPMVFSGTGFLVHPDGLLITAFHVVEASKKIEVRCGDLPPQITLKTASSSTDLAVLRIPTRVKSYCHFCPRCTVSLALT
jgi:S1-C subfamily serine protease